MTDTEIKKELLIMFMTDHVTVLVPKKRGVGFVKHPVGHHATPASDFFQFDLGVDPFCEGDGYLSLQSGWVTDELKARYEREIFPRMSEFYGWPCRVVSSDEFWSNMPLKAK